MIISCASFIPEKESWEGIKDNILRVYIHHEHMDDLNGSDNSREKELLEVTGRNRAEMLLLSYIRMHVAGIDRIIACQQMIPHIVARGTVRHFRCNESHCAAFVDYDVRDFLKTAGLQSRQ